MSIVTTASRLILRRMKPFAPTSKKYAIFITDIDLRYNKITDHGAKALANLISKAPILLGLNLQGNNIKSEGAQYLAEALKECTRL